VAVRFIDGWNRSTKRKGTDLSQVTEKLYNIIQYRVHLRWVWLELVILVVVGTVCIGSCKSNYHMITTTTDPWPNDCINFQKGSIFHGLCVVIILHFIKVLRFNYAILIYKGQHSTSQRHHKIIRINGDLLVLCVMFCTLLFVLLLFFFRSSCYLSFFELRILITPLLSSNSSNTL